MKKQKIRHQTCHINSPIRGYKVSAFHKEVRNLASLFERGNRREAVTGQFPRNTVEPQSNTQFRRGGIKQVFSPV